MCERERDRLDRDGERDTHKERARENLGSAVFVSVSLSFGSVVLGLSFRSSVLVCWTYHWKSAALPAPANLPSGGPWVSFIPVGVLLRVRQPLPKVCLYKCMHDQCVGAVFPPPPSP